MTTQTRKSLKQRKAELEAALLDYARSIAPREGFLVEPILHDHVGEDPESEIPPHDVLFFVVNGKEDELRSFYRRLARTAVELTGDDVKLRWSVGIEAILPNEIPSWLSTPTAS